MNKLTKYIVSAVCALSLVSAVCNASTTNVTITNANFKLLDPNAWTLELGGTGTTATKGDTSTLFGTTAQLGRTGTLLLPFEAGVRQGVSYDSNESSGNKYSFNTALYSDWTVVSLFKKHVDLYAGGNIGAEYGATPFLFTAGPEGGIQIWLNKSRTWAVDGRVDYEFDLNNNSPRSENQLRYFLGIKGKLGK